MFTKHSQNELASEAETESVQLKEIDDLPGPPALPFIGSLHLVSPKEIHRDVEKMSAKYGKFFRLSLGTKKMLVIADHSEMGGIPGLFFAEGQAWRNQRRMVMQGLAPLTVKNYFPFVVKVLSRLQERWDIAANGNASIDLADDLRRMAVDVIAGLAFGTDVNTVGGEDNKIQRCLDTVLPIVRKRYLAPFPYWRYITLPSEKEVAACMRTLNESIQDLIAQARVRLNENPALTEKPSNVLEAMIVAADEPNCGINDADIVGNVLTLLIGGEDIVGDTIVWLLYLLHSNPAMLKRAQEEVRRHSTNPAEFTIEHFDALDYVEACTLEAMRLKPVAPFMTMEALEDTVLNGIRVPKGSLIWCVLRHDSVNKDLVRDAEEFNPDRWLATTPNNENEHLVKKSSIPFGAGPRSCPGRYLAMHEIKGTLALLLGNFEINTLTTADNQAPKEIMGFVMAAHGLSMKIQRRTMR
jgi:cytochrome P450